MNDSPRERFVEEAVAPFSDNAELQLLARDELERRIDDSAERFPSLPPCRCTKSWWIGATVLLSLLVLLGPARDLYRGWSSFEGFVLGTIPDFDLKTIRKAFASGRNREEATFLVGDWTREMDDDRWRPLREMKPDDPAVLARYVAAHLEEHGGIPADLVREIERLDADNGWYPFMRAGHSADEAVEEDRLSYAERKKGKAPSWTIHDAQALEKTLALAERAASKPAFKNPADDLTVRQAQLLKPPSDLRGRLRLGMFLMQAGIPQLQPAQDLARAYEAAGWRSGEEGDRERLRKLIRSHRRLSRFLIEDATTILDTTIAQMFLKAPLGEFRQAGEKVGLPADALEPLAVLAEHLQSSPKEMRARRDEELETLFERRSGNLAGSTPQPLLSQVEEPLSITPSMLKPGRRMEHAATGRAFSIALWVVLAVFGTGAAASTFLMSPFDRKLGASLGRAFTNADRAWVLALGVGAPILGFLLFRGAMPTGALEWNVKETFLPTKVQQWLALALVMLFLPGAVARHRVRRRFHFLKRLPQIGKWRVAGVVVVATVIPVAGWAPPAFQEKHALEAAGWLLLVVGGATLVGGTVAGRIAHESRNIERALIHRITGPALLGTLTASLAMTVGFHLEERYWFSRDPFSRPDSGTPHLSAFEARIADIKRGELRELLESQ